MNLIDAFILVGRANDAAGTSNLYSPLFLVVVVVVLAILLLVAGVVLWRTIFANPDTTDFSSRYRQSVENTPNDLPPAPETNIKYELNPKTVSSSADTVSNKIDDDIVDENAVRELRSGFSSQATVDAMGDQSVSTDDSDDDLEVG